VVSPSKWTIRPWHSRVDIEILQRLRKRNTRQLRVIGEVTKTPDLIDTEASKIE
jgi:hypothetical protein